MHAPGDGLYASRYRPDGGHVPIGSARVHGDGSDLLIVTVANGLWMSLRAANRLEAEGIRCRVLVMDETRRSGGVSEAVITGLVDAGFRGAMKRVTSEDSFVPVLAGERQIERAAREMMR